LRNRTASTSEYLAFVSAKYEVDPDEFFHTLVLAEDNKKSRCGNLDVECRGKTQDKVTFLILTDSKVVAQFSVVKEFLLQQGHPIKNFMETDKVRRFLAKKTTRSSCLQIRDLRAGMRQVSLKARVLEIAEPSVVYTRYGNYANVANALIGDETGTIKLCLWNEQIGSVSAGDTIQIENARTITFRGQRQLNIGRRGLLSSVEDSGCQLHEAISSEPVDRGG
jgi:replication factor A1